MPKRTYNEAVDIMVDWWIEKSFKNPINQNNGDNSDDGWLANLLMNDFSRKAQQEIDEFKIQKFKGKLTEILLDGEGKGRYYNDLDVDYHPNEKLQIACRYAEIDPICLPCKTFTFINNQNEVEGRYQYGGDWFKI